MWLLRFLLLCGLFPTADLIENTQIYYEMYSMLFPVCMIIKALKAMCTSRSKCFSDVFEIFIIIFLITLTYYIFLIWVLSYP
jgi:hypothetical protein